MVKQTDRPPAYLPKNQVAFTTELAVRGHGREGQPFSSNFNLTEKPETHLDACQRTEWAIRHLPGVVLELGKDDGVIANYLALHGLDNGDDVGLDHDRRSSSSSESLDKGRVCESVSATELSGTPCHEAFVEGNHASSTGDSDADEC